MSGVGKSNWLTAMGNCTTNPPPLNCANAVECCLRCGRGDRGLGRGRFFEHGPITEGT